MNAKSKSIQEKSNAVEPLLFKEEVYRIVGAAFEVHNHLGSGFLEPVYQEALEKEFQANGIPSVAQQELKILYKGDYLKKSYIADFVAFEWIIIEIKAEEHLSPLDQAQLLNYLSATNMHVGILINFGSKRMEWKRLIKT